MAHFGSKALTYGFLVGCILAGGLGGAAVASGAGDGNSGTEANAPAKRGTASEEVCTPTLVNKCIEECPASRLCPENMKEHQCSAAIINCMGESATCQRAANNGDGCNETLSGMDDSLSTSPTLMVAGATGRSPKKDDARLKCSLDYERKILGCFIWFKDGFDNARGDKKAESRAKAQYDLCMRLEKLARNQCLRK